MDHQVNLFSTRVKKILLIFLFLYYWVSSTHVRTTFSESIKKLQVFVIQFDININKKILAALGCLFSFSEFPIFALLFINTLYFLLSFESRSQHQQQQLYHGNTKNTNVKSLIVSVHPSSTKEREIREENLHFTLRKYYNAIWSSINYIRSQLTRLRISSKTGKYTGLIHFPRKICIWQCINNRRGRETIRKNTHSFTHTHTNENELHVYPDREFYEALDDSM